ncbi:MAG: Gfo/Idh/MocA family oxidoreductase [Phycisphaerae bacterium]|jgi:predicted dehydrogenase
MNSIKEKEKDMPGQDFKNVLGIGLIGAGARLRTVVSGLLKESGGKIRIAAIYDPDSLSVESVRSEFGMDWEECGSEEALVSHPGVAWVFIGSPNSQHSRQAILALEAGRDVFCEKPLATNLKDCLAVREAVHQSGRTFAFGLVLRYSPHYQKVKELLNSGVVGEILSFEFNETISFNHGGYIFGNWRRKKAAAGSHVLEKCCHDLDLANWLVDSFPVSAASFGGRRFFIPENARHMKRLGVDEKGQQAYRAWPDPHGIDPFSEGADILDHQVAILEYANKATATFHTNCNAAIPERRFYICGAEGGLRADMLTGRIEWRRIGHDTEIETIDTGVADGHGGGDDVMASGLAKTLLEGAAPLASVEEGIRACVAAFGIDRSIDEGRMIDCRSLWDACAMNY